MKEFLNKRNVINLLLLGIMVLAIPLTVKLARQQQILFSRAAAAQIVFLTKAEGGTDCVINRGGKKVAVCNDIKVRFTAPTGDDIKFSRTSLLPQEGLVSKVYAQGSCSDIGNPGNGYNADYCTNCDYTWCNDDGGYPMWDLSSCSNQCSGGSSACTYREEISECPGNYRECNGTDEGLGCHYNSNVVPNCQGRCPSGGAVTCADGSTQYSVGDIVDKCESDSCNRYTCQDDGNWGYAPGQGQCSNCGGGGGGVSCTDPSSSVGGKALKCAANSGIDHFTCTGNTEPGSNGWSFGRDDKDGHEACPSGTHCAEVSGTASCEKDSTPDKCTTGLAGDITQTQAECVLGKKPGMLDFYKSNGWCTDKKEQYPGIVNNWRGINGPDEDQIITDCGIKNVECKTDSAGGITATQASCVIGKKAGLLEFYKNNRWCTDKTDYYPGIVNNWKGIITVQADKDILSSCGIGDGGAQKCFLCRGNLWKYPDDNPNATCTDAADSCSSTKTGTCKGDVTRFLDKPCESTGQTITKYRFAEDPSELASARVNNYQQGGVIVSHTFSDTPGEKSIWYQFGDDAGNWTEQKRGGILLVGPDPEIRGASCNLDITDGSLKFQVTGDNFGVRDPSNSHLAADNSNLEIREWANQKVVARMANPSDTTTGKTYGVTLTRADGTKDTASCSVNTTQISLGAKLFCRAPSSFDQDNVNLLIVQNVLGVGTTGASGGSFKAGDKVRETVTITKEGVISNLKTKLQEGIEYIVCVKAPKSLRLCTNKFTAVAGNNIITHRFDLPVGDVNDDEAINSADASICKAEWGPARAGRAKACEFNRDNVTNSFEWGCLLHDFNKPNQPEPL